MRKFLGEKQTGLIFAADLPTFEDNARVLDAISEFVDVIKVCNPLVMREGAATIRKLAERYSKPVFADLKVADVPHTSAQIVKIVADNGGSAVMVHGFVGPDGISECMEAANDKVGIIIQLELTNPGGKIFTAPIANDMARLAAEMGVYGTQAPGNRPNRIAEIRGIIGPEPVIVCCGVGAQGGKHSEVMQAGGTYSIVGRAIYNADDPVRAVEAVLI
ncbi:orotidine-5'-phosphate decarboxylase [Ensifer sp. ENS11]|uniref:orotidine-5'-phosphate decarboxylase n=1 Tax=Ensifer sp. ENS11 TaxID=2769291 RepID=UPI0017812509|nr:orotidine-5'-phosphate decarboxylase [Ensifer sp. ENS11]MBD9490507.1 orotidine-5'-phosphate decarboxylase [Ensifer sp. ENS11]MDP9633043.1 orotidine-5'-phosphate decarboxylase [Ensifer adhaerens]